jgi:two-component system sensor histidine kinase/response regulator
MARLRILIVEDDGDVREAIALAMADAGAEVVVAADGVEALAELRSGPRPSVILLDCRLPRLGCEELLRRMRADPRFDHVPVITMSGEECGGGDGEVVARLEGPVDVADLRKIVLSLFEAAA